MAGFSRAQGVPLHRGLHQLDSSRRYWCFTGWCL